MSIRFVKYLALFVLLISGQLLLCCTAGAQNVTLQQLEAFVPGDQDLPGFVRIQTAATLPGVDSAYYARIYTGKPEPDEIELSQDVKQWSPSWSVLPNDSGYYNHLGRNLFSQNGKFVLGIVVTLCDSAEIAHKEVATKVQSSEVIYKRGTYSGNTEIGDESWVNSYPDPSCQPMLCRYGRMIVFVQGGGSFAAKRTGISAYFPSTAIEATAYQILLNASQQAKLIGVSTQNTSLAVNGHTLQKNALKVAGQVYVPVQEFAKAMGLTSRWNNKTGSLTLSEPQGKQIALTAGSTAATVGGAKAAALTVPVLKDGGQPVMALGDLLRLTGGRITGHAGNTVQVKG